MLRKSRSTFFQTLLHASWICTLQLLWKCHMLTHGCSTWPPLVKTLRNSGSTKLIDLTCDKVVKHVQSAYPSITPELLARAICIAQNEVLTKVTEQAPPQARPLQWLPPRGRRAPRASLHQLTPQRVWQRYLWCRTFRHSVRSSVWQSFYITPLGTHNDNGSYLDEAGIDTWTHYPGSLKDWQPDTQSCVACQSFAKYNYIANQMLTLPLIDTEAAWSLMAQLTSKYHVRPMLYNSCADDTQILYWDAKYLRDVQPLCSPIPLETAGSGPQQILTHKGICRHIRTLFHSDASCISTVVHFGSSALTTLRVLSCPVALRSSENKVIMGNSTIPT